MNSHSPVPPSPTKSNSVFRSLFFLFTVSLILVVSAALSIFGGYLLYEFLT